MILINSSVVLQLVLIWFRFVEKSPIKIALDVSHAAFLSPERMIISLKDGDLYPFNSIYLISISIYLSIYLFILSFSFTLSFAVYKRYLCHLFTDGRTIQRMVVVKAGASVLTSCLCTLPENLLFLGSRLGDSILIHYQERAMEYQELQEQQQLQAKQQQEEYRIHANVANTLMMNEDLVAMVC